MLPMFFACPHVPLCLSLICGFASRARLTGPSSDSLLHLPPWSIWLLSSHPPHLVLSTFKPWSFAQHSSDRLFILMSNSLWFPRKLSDAFWSSWFACSWSSRLCLRSPLSSSAALSVVFKILWRSHSFIHSLIELGSTWLNLSFVSVSLNFAFWFIWSFWFVVLLVYEPPLIQIKGEAPGPSAQMSGLLSLWLCIFL